MSLVVRQIGLLFAAIVAAWTLPTEATAQTSFNKLTASVTYGPYVRFEFGSAMPSLDGAFWLPPGAADPRINFDANGSDTGFGAMGVGFDWQNGFRADMSIFSTGTSDVTAPCSSASDGSPCAVHADISSATVQTTGLMGSLFYAPLEARGSNSIFQPFVVAGVGIARNSVGDWTRSNPAATQPFRTFAGDTSTDLAWSLGVGASLQVTRPGRWPIIVEATWRYYDFGTASGSSTPLPGNGVSQPREAFNFNNNENIVTLGVRIPLKRY